MAENFRIKQQTANGQLVIHPETNADVVLETETKKVMTAAERTKLSGIESNAQANVIEEIKVNGKKVTPSGKSVNITIDTTNYIPVTDKGANGGVATLGSDGKVPSSQLPSYVDDVLEADSKSKFPTTGETGKIYVAKDTNLTYRWSGTAYIEISPSLALGENSSTAYPGDKGKANATAIDALKTRTTAIETKNTNQDTEITNIKNGTTKVAKAGTADTATTATTATSAGKLSTAHKIALSGDATGSVAFDGSADKTISLALANTGVTAGTYSVVEVDAKGRALKGGTILEIGAADQTAPSNSLAIGGLFLEKI